MNYDKLLSRNLNNEINGINPSEVSYLVDKFLDTIYETIQAYCDMSNECHNNMNYIKALDLLVKDEYIKKEISKRYF